MPCSRKGGICALITVVAILIGTTFLYAGGQQEDLFSEVDRLINEKKYNEALRKLSEIWATDPDQADLAQKRLGDKFEILWSLLEKTQ